MEGVIYSNTFKILCPKCKSCITYQSPTFGGDNDSGWIVLECAKCKEKYETLKAKHSKTKATSTFLIVKAKNPYETSISQGAEKKEYFDSNIYEFADVMQKYPTAQKINEGVEVSGYNPNEENHNDCLNLPNFICSCGASLVDSAEVQFDADASEIGKVYGDVKTMYYKWSRQDYKQLEIEVPFKCANCQAEYLAYFGKVINGDADCDWNQSSHQLVNINQKIDRLKIMGTKSKTECLKILSTFLARWNVIAQEIILVTPFIGTQYQNAEELEESWNWIVKNTNPTKTRLITRTKTLNDFRKEYPKFGKDIDLFVNYELEPDIITNSEKLISSHSKFYAGIIGDRVELLSGSFNLVGGPSNEQISFDVLSLDFFKDNYLKPLKLDCLRRDPFAMDIRKENDKYGLEEKKYSELFPLTE